MSISSRVFHQVVGFSGEIVAYQKIVLCGNATSELSVTTMTTKTKISKTKTLKVQHICDRWHFDFFGIPIQRLNYLNTQFPRPCEKKKCTNSRLGYEALRLHKRKRWTSWSNFRAIFHVCHWNEEGLVFTRSFVSCLLVL